MGEVVGLEMGLVAIDCEGVWCCHYGSVVDHHVDLWDGFVVEDGFGGGADAGQGGEVDREEFDGDGRVDGFNG